MASSLFSSLGVSLLAIASAALLLGLAWMLGSSILTRLSLPAVSRLERSLCSIGLGVAILSTLTFLAGVGGAYTPVALRFLLVGSSVCALLLRRQISKQERDPAPDWRRERWALCIGILAAVYLLSLLPSVLTPMVDYDGLAYHVGAPKRWLEMGRIAPLPTHLHTLWPMGEEMLNGLLLATVGDAGSKPLMFLFALLTAAATFALGSRLANRSVGILAAAILLLRAGAPSINTTSVEMPMTFFVLLAGLLLAVRAQTEERTFRTNMLVLAAIMVGFACAVKLNGLLCLAFFVGALILLDWRRTSARQIAISTAAFSGCAIVCAAPWYLRTWWIAGNPIYPFAYSVLGGRAWSADASRNLALYFRTFDLPGDDLAQRALFVKRHLLKLAGMMGVGLVIPGSPRWVRGFVLGAGAFAMIQAVTSDNPRFLLPPTPFAAIALAWWLVKLSERFPVTGWLWAAGFAALAVPGITKEVRNLAPVNWGGQGREEFVLHYVNNRPAFEWANTHLPTDARVLYGPDNRTYYLQRDVFWSSALYHRDIDYDSPAAFSDSLRSIGIHWLILNRDVYKDSAISFETRMGWRENERRRLEEAATAGILRFRAEGVDVYELP